MQKIEYVIYLTAESTNLAFTYATIDMKANWKKYREDLERGER